MVEMMLTLKESIKNSKTKKKKKGYFSQFQFRNGIFA